MCVLINTQTNNPISTPRFFKTISEARVDSYKKTKGVDLEYNVPVEFFIDIIRVPYGENNGYSIGGTYVETHYHFKITAAKIIQRFWRNKFYKNENTLNKNIKLKTEMEIVRKWFELWKNNASQARSFREYDEWCQTHDKEMELND